MPMEYKSLFLLTFLIFVMLFTILTIVYYFNKLNSNQNRLSISSIFLPFNMLIGHIQQRNITFNGFFTFKRRFMTNDDSLNLAENQIFDECLFTDDFYFANQPTKNNNLLSNGSNSMMTAQNNNSNPYRNLTVAT
jgi:hypothetical protein